MTLEALRVLVHEVRERLDRAPVRSSVYTAIVGEVRLACVVLDLAKGFDEVREGLHRAVIELALRNVLSRRELAGAHDAAQRALRCVVAVGDARDVEVPPPSPVTIDPEVATAVDVGLALVHVRAARALVDEILAFTIEEQDARAEAADLLKSFAIEWEGERVARELAEKLEGVATILQRVHDEVAA